MYTTDFGDAPTHVLPDIHPMSRYAFILEEGQTIPHPASTKALLSGPSFIISSGGAFFEYDLDVDDPFGPAIASGDWLEGVRERRIVGLWSND